MATSRKQPAERVIEALTWASVVIWLGFALIAHILNYVWLIVLVLSVILLSSAIYQRSRNWETSLAIWCTNVGVLRESACPVTVSAHNPSRFTLER